MCFSFVDSGRNILNAPSSATVFILNTFEACNRQFKWNWLVKWLWVDWIGKCYCRLICGNSTAWNANMENGRQSWCWGFMQLSNIYWIDRPVAPGALTTQDSPSTVLLSPIFHAHFWQNWNFNHFYYSPGKTCTFRAFNVTRLTCSDWIQHIVNSIHVT